MRVWLQTLPAALVTSTTASLTSTVALAVLAEFEGQGALQPLNATSHWLHGEQAASCTRVDLAHTAVGYATHHAATLFWAVLFERLLGRQRSRRPLPLVRDALGMSAFAAAVDYTITPKRFTPGWEFVLSKRSMAAAYAAMALGLAIGAASTRSRD